MTYYNYERDYFNRRLGYILSIIATIIAGFFLIFIRTYDTIICSGNYCNLYSQSGVFGIKNKYDSFKRSDVVGFQFDESHHSTDSSKYSSTHTDYRPILIMNDGEHYELPFKYCRNRTKAEAVVKQIRGKNYFKESNAMW